MLAIFSFSMDNLSLSVLPFLVAALVSYVSTPVIIKFSSKLGIIDDPKLNKHPKVTHTYPVPRGGGVPIFAGILIAALVFIPLDKHLVGILIGGFILMTLGLIDDRYNLNPYKRLLIQFLVAAIPIAAGIGIAFVANPLGGIFDLSVPRISFQLFGGSHSIWILSDLFALMWMVTLMNFVNIGASGLDGQLSGTITIAALTIGALSLGYSADITEWPVIILAMVTAGAYFGFLPWHIYPQKIMPGFGGSTLAGFMLGILSILSTTKVGTLMVVLAVPLIDTGFVVVKRLIAGKSPFWGDRGHLHHKLLDSGYSKKQVALFYWAATAVLGIIAINLNATSKLYTILGVSVMIGGLLLWLTRKKQ